MVTGRIIDTSSNNHPSGAPIDWAALARQGFTTAIIKATEGTGYVNPFYAQDMAHASAAGLQTCAYHFASMGDVNAEVAHFKSVAGNKAAVLDYETNVNVTWANSFLGKLGRPPDERMIYGSASTLVNFYHSVQALAWPAAYGQGYPGWGVMWQFTSAADDSPAVPTTFDESKWYGTEDQYRTFFGLMKPQPEGPDMIAATGDGKGYYVVNAQGAVYAYGTAVYHDGINNSGPGGTTAMVSGDFATGIAVCSSGGYWISTNAGRIYAFGGAPYLGAPE